MIDEQQRKTIREVSVTLQIITGAMVSGVMIFACIVLVLFQSEDKLEADTLPIISYAAAGVAVFSMLAAAIVPRVVGVVDPKHFLAGDISKLLNTYRTRVIIRAALLEGAAFFNLIAHMLEGQMINVILTGVLLVGMLFRFPTTNGIEAWVEDEQKSIEEMQSLQN